MLQQQKGKGKQYFFLISAVFNVFVLIISNANFSNASLQLKLVFADVSIYSIPQESASCLASEYCTSLSFSKFLFISY